MKNNRRSAAYTLPELLIVLTILGALFSLTVINLFSSYNKNTLRTTLSTLIADLKEQQLKAMVGDTEGQSTQSPYGIYLPHGGISYVLFRGSTYSESDPGNFTVNLNSDLLFSSVLLPDSQLVFAPGSGEILNYDPGFDSFALQNIQSQETKTIRFNELGNIITIN